MIVHVYHTTLHTLILASLSGKVRFLGILEILGFLGILASLHYNYIKIKLNWLLLKLANSTSEKWRKLMLMNTFCL